MACEEFLEQMSEAANQIDQIDSDIQQLEMQKLAQQGIMYGAYMLYMNCLSNQEGQGARLSRQDQLAKNPTVYDLMAWVKKKIKLLRRKKK